MVKRKASAGGSKAWKRQPPNFVNIQCSQLVGRSRAVVHPDSVPVCSCSLPAAGQAGCGEECLNRLLYVECTPGHCRLGAPCSNQRLQRKQTADTKLKYIGAKGWGLCAAEDIVCGALVAEYVGEVVNNSEAERRAMRYEAAGLTQTYIMNLGEEVIDATERGGMARFINHSCSPNCETQKWQVCGEVAVGIFAQRCIKAGEELSYDYNFDWNGGKRIRCLCGAAKCLGFLGAHSQGFTEALAHDLQIRTPAKAMWQEASGEAFEIDNLDTFSSDSEVLDGGPPLAVPGPQHQPSMPTEQQPVSSMSDASTKPGDASVLSCATTVHLIGTHASPQHPQRIDKPLANADRCEHPKQQPARLQQTTAVPFSMSLSACPSHLLKLGTVAGMGHMNQAGGSSKRTVVNSILGGLKAGMGEFAATSGPRSSF